ncbi:MAG: LapA family protein [Rhodobacteraceae bacterium]|nr:LapA family protein [Paracoccaceae bacterium]
MKTIQYAFWGLIGLCLVVLGLANRGTVTLRAMPETVSEFLGISPDIQLPLYLVIFLGVAVGLLIGFFWEWLREGKLRASSRGKTREVAALQREVGRLKTEKNEGKDDVIALLDRAS